MRSVRRRVRAWVTTWLVCQFAAVSAFAPRECCEAHRPVAATAAARDSGDYAKAHAGHHTGHGATAATAAGHAHHHSASNGTTVRTVAGTRGTARTGICPMRGPNGEPCPMHSDQTATPAAATGSAVRAGDGSGPGGRTCIMRGACHGPITAVVTLFLTPADPLGAYTLAADQTRALHVGPAADPTLDLSPSVVTPPPRA